MKKIGIVGGVAWPSTVEYYRLLCTWSQAHFRAQGVTGPLPTPPIMIESLVMAETRKLRAQPGDGEDAWAAFDSAFRDALLRLQAGGCDVGLIANNTSHNRLHSIRQGVDMPIVSIIDETAKATKAAGFEHALFLGTSVTMRSDAYAEALATLGITANARLSDDVIDGLQAIIDTEFYETGTVRGREELLKLCDQHVEDRAGTAILLACTELPLAFADHLDDGVFESSGFNFVNTSAVHARAALNLSLGL